MDMYCFYLKSVKKQDKKYFQSPGTDINLSVHTQQPYPATVP